MLCVEFGLRNAYGTNNKLVCVSCRCNCKYVCVHRELCEIDTARTCRACCAGCQHALLRACVLHYKAQARCFLRNCRVCCSVILHKVLFKQVVYAILLPVRQRHFHKCNIAVSVTQQYANAPFAVSIAHVNNSVQRANAHKLVKCCICHFVSFVMLSVIA